MDVYIAALGRSGSTALANWLTTPPTHVVFHEPNLLRAHPTRLLESQLADWGMSKDEALSGSWGAKETSSDLHGPMLDRFSPSKVILCVRSVREAALSLFEKHRRQGLLDRYTDQWVADYLVREAEGLVDLADRLARGSALWTVFRYEEFGENSLRQLADWIGWPGGGDLARGFEAFGRGFEVQRQRNRNLPTELAQQASKIAERCASFESRFYGTA